MSDRNFLISLAILLKIDLYVSTAILAELATKLTDKFHWPAERVSVVIKRSGKRQPLSGRKTYKSSTGG